MEIGIIVPYSFVPWSSCVVQNVQFCFDSFPNAQSCCRKQTLNKMLINPPLKIVTGKCAISSQTAQLFQEITEPYLEITLYICVPSFKV